MDTSQRYIKLLEQLNDVIFEIDQRGQIQDIRGKGLSDFRYSPNEIIKKSFSLFFNDSSSFGALIQDHLASGKDLFLSNIPLFTKDHKAITCSMTLNFIQETATYMGTVRNIDEKIKLEREREELRELLIKNEKLSFIGSLVQGFAHNLNSPISGIIVGCDVLAKKFGKHREIDLIKSLTMRINDIVNNLLDKSRKESMIAKQWCNLNEIVTEILNFLESDLAFKHKYTINQHLDPNIPLVQGIYGDFSQSIQNIIVNAIDAMKYSKNKVLTLRTYVQRNVLVLEIEDTGEGISEEFKNKVFEPFFTTKEKEKGNPQSGTGLGLTITKKLLSSYGIDIYIDTNKEQGTIFKLCFPEKVQQK